MCHASAGCQSLPQVLSAWLADGSLVVTVTRFLPTNCHMVHCHMSHTRLRPFHLPSLDSFDTLCCARLTLPAPSRLRLRLPLARALSSATCPLRLVCACACHLPAPSRLQLARSASSAPAPATCPSAAIQARIHETDQTMGSRVPAPRTTGRAGAGTRGGRLRPCLAGAIATVPGSPLRRMSKKPRMGC
eukprot:366352-Chlamydomonas_euryale.AAC.4